MAYSEQEVDSSKVLIMFSTVSGTLNGGGVTFDG
jgi:hypothetical protein